MVEAGATGDVSKEQPAKQIVQALAQWSPRQELTLLDKEMLSVSLPVYATKGGGHSSQEHRSRSTADAELDYVVPGVKHLQSQQMDVFGKLVFSGLSLAGPNQDVVLGQAKFSFDYPYETRQVKDGATVNTIEWRALGIDTDVKLPLGAFVPVGKLNTDPGQSVYFVIETRLAE